jgi:hypothetical protein
MPILPQVLDPDPNSENCGILTGRESPVSSLVGLDWEDPEDIRVRLRIIEQVGSSWNRRAGELKLEP